MDSWPSRLPLFGLQLRPETGGRAMEARLHRAYRDAEDLGRLAVREAQVVVEHEDRTLIHREAPEAAIELVSQRDGLLAVGQRRGVDRQDRDLAAPPPAIPPRGPVAAPDQHLVQPRIEAVRVAQAADVQPGRHERVLDGVVGPVRVADDQPGEPEETLDRARRELREGVMVAFPGPNDEVSLHRPCLAAAATRPRSASMGSRPRRSVPSAVLSRMSPSGSAPPAATGTRDRSAGRDARRRPGDRR